MTLNQKGNSSLITALASILGWGMVGVFIRLSSLKSPLLIISIRFMITCFVLFLVLFFQKKTRQVFKDLFSDKIIVILSLILFLTYFFGTMAFMLAPIGEVTLLISISPFFVILFRRLTGNSISKNEFIGTVVAVLGVATIMYPHLSSPLNFSGSSVLGHIFAITGALLFAVFVMISNRQNVLNKQINTLSVTLGTCFFGILIFIYIILFSKVEFSLEALSGANIASIIALGIFSTAIPTFGFAYASKKLPPLLLSNLLLLEPVFAIIFAYLFLSEAPNMYIYPGILLIFIGLSKVSKKVSEK
ncbi:EamA domain-containing membrane protein RarD [Chryseobacterium sp. 52]|uniref:DMT family transporter n=1 Tax=Chryseobacterium sp. 52 TaxID=2035213 RepID=UPI000C1A8062|nr:DMT family transporter [Chryseobacterium sp. 52]PIF43903.1 EamA domain-containing membrane protein RarD [Chryseobacterium sp. 52]